MRWKKIITNDQQIKFCKVANFACLMAVPGDSEGKREKSL